MEPDMDPVTTEMQKTQNEFEAAVREMTDKLKAQTATMNAPVEQPRPQADMRPEALTKLANEQGVGAAIQAVGVHVLAPMQAEAYDLAVKTQRRVVERDAELGRWAEKHSNEIDAAIKADP